MNKLITSTLVSVGIVAASMSLASAQSVTPPAAGAAQAQQGERHHGMRQQHQKRAFSMPGERVEARLAYVKTALKITDAQQAQWNAFADVSRKQAAERDKKINEFRAKMAQGGRTAHEKPSAIARLEFQQQRHAAAIARLNEQLAVQKPLYAALSAEQKAVADEVLAPRVDMGGRGGRGGSRHGGRMA